MKIKEKIKEFIELHGLLWNIFSILGIFVLYCIYRPDIDDLNYVSDHCPLVVVSSFLYGILTYLVIDLICEIICIIKERRKRK